MKKQPIVTSKIGNSLITDFTTHPRPLTSKIVTQRIANKLFTCEFNQDEINLIQRYVELMSFWHHKEIKSVIKISDKRNNLVGILKPENNWTLYILQDTFEKVQSLKKVNIRRIIETAIKNAALNKEYNQYSIFTN